ncbi:UNVERIFIED_CONTAM: hypothetical protein FKN15_017439 [Acipenser sinensis]
MLPLLNRPVCNVVLSILSLMLVLTQWFCQRLLQVGILYVVTRVDCDPVDPYQTGTKVTDPLPIPTWYQTETEVTAPVPNRPDTEPTWYRTDLIPNRLCVKFTEPVPTQCLAHQTGTELTWYRPGLDPPGPYISRLRQQLHNPILYIALLVPCIMPWFYPCETCKASLPMENKHGRCSSCLGLEHAEEALVNHSFCKCCAPFFKRMLEKRLSHSSKEFCVLYSCSALSPPLSLREVAASLSQGSAPRESRRRTRESNFHSKASVLMVDELLSAYPHQLSFSDAGLRIMITSHFPPRTRLTMASRLLITERQRLINNRSFSNGDSEVALRISNMHRIENGLGTSSERGMNGRHGEEDGIEAGNETDNENEDNENNENDEEEEEDDDNEGPLVPFELPGNCTRQRLINNRSFSNGDSEVALRISNMHRIENGLGTSSERGMNGRHGEEDGIEAGNETDNENEDNENNENDEEEEDDDDNEGPLVPFELPAGALNKVKWLVGWPLSLLLYFTVPNCANPRWEKWFMVTFATSTMWIAGFSYIMVWMIHLNSKGLIFSVGLLLASVFLTVVAVHLNRWKLDKKLGFGCLLLYTIFLCFSIMIEFNVFTFVNLPMCQEL